MRKRRHHFMLSLRRFFSRPQWAIRLFNLSDAPDVAGPGLVMIQIDGLSRAEMEYALASGRLPNLRKLMRREGYQVHDFYSGLPSSTPAVQGELFYGVPAAVPAFGFRDRAANAERSMLNGDAAREVQAEISEAGAGLMEGGSAYSNIYTGGSEEPHYCAANLGSSTSRRMAAWWLMALLHVPSLLRAVGLTVAELGLAVVDMVRGVRSHERFLQELKFIPARVAVCVLLREVITFGVRVDMARGLPVVLVNFLGYDEQSHRRGPHSAFAHWTLRGIDQAVGQILRSAKHTSSRHYQVWVYSDHGQESTVPYRNLTGEDIHSVVAEVVSEVLEEPHAHGPLSPSEGRSSLTGWRWLQRFAPKEPTGPLADTAEAAANGENWIITKGPVGHVYLPGAADDAQRLAVAQALVARQVPAVAVRQADGSVMVCTPERTGALSEMLAVLVEPDRLHADWLREDLARLIQHRNSGDLVLLGWQPGVDRPVSFADENGGHGGYGPRETQAFALLPEAVAAEVAGKELRPAGLRQLAMDYLGRTDTVAFPAQGAMAADSPVDEPADTAAEANAATADTGRRVWGSQTSVRVVTWNVHSCCGADGIIDPLRVATVLRHLAPDIICLQEVDDCPSLPQLLGQLRVIANVLGMHAVWHPVCAWGERRYGLGILSRQAPTTTRLVTYDAHGRQQTRGLVYACYEFAGESLHILNTHWGLRMAERRAQALALLGAKGIQDIPEGEPIVVCGDLNCSAASEPYRLLHGALHNAWHDQPQRKPVATFPSLLPVRRIDHILMNQHLHAVALHVPRDRRVRLASDHLPVVADLVMTPMAAHHGIPKQVGDRL